MEGAGGGVGGSEAYTAAANMNMMMKWDPRGQQWEQQQQGSGVGGLEELFSMYGIRYYTAARIAEMGFTARTLVNMTDHELDDMMTSLSHIFRWDLLVGERYGIKAAVRAHRTRLLQLHNSSNINHHHLLSPAANNNNANFDALSHSHDQGVSEEAVQQERVGSWMEAAGEKQGKKQRRSSKGGAHRRSGTEEGDQNEVEEDDEDVVGGANTNTNNNNKMMMMSSSSSALVMSERQREHPFIVTDPGEVPRGKKNGLDYLFSLYDQCREFLIQVQSIAKERGDKCPTKVTNEVFRYAKKAGASHINKPKMRHYVHCYALHCLDEEASDALRRAYKERGENVGAWRQACYGPLVAIAARQASSDIDSIFNSHPLLSIWYVPTKLRHLCHAHRNNPTTSSDHGATTTTTTTTTPSTSAYHHHHLSFC